MYSSVVLYPHDSLKAGTEPVTLDYIRSDEFRFRISAMFRTMYYRNGVGLAAPQMGWNARLFIGNPTGRPEHHSQSFVLINPELKFISGELIDTEGCLSVPGIWLPVKRYDKISVKALNEEGHEFEFEARGFLSRIIQHEYDHLDGLMMMDRLDSEELSKYDKELCSFVERVKNMRHKREIEKRKKEKKKKKKDRARAKAKEKRKRKRK